MFTGIVEGPGEVVGVDEAPDGRRLRVATDVADSFAAGQSVSVNGVCLTVERDRGDEFEVFVAAETAARTTLADATAGDRVNVERALRADDRLDGHVVQGHVDTTTAVRAVESVGEDWRFTFALPAGYEQYVAPKGSVALDGVSLTVASVDDVAGTFDVAVIPTTYGRTTLAEREPGDAVNVEVDVLAKYVARLLPEGVAPGAGAAGTDGGTDAPE
ncbi:MAG: riboflavin synthase [Halobacteriaceae archaeon]